MRRHFLVTRRLATTTLALAAAAFLATCLASNEPRSAPGPDALGDASEPTQACPLIGCADGLAVALESENEWPHGTYRFEIQADDVHVLCRAALPVPPCTGSKEIPIISNVTCDPVGVVQIVESSCALEPLAPRTLGQPNTAKPGTPTSSPRPPSESPPVTHGLPVIRLDPRLRPRQVEIAVGWNGKLVGHTQFAPRFAKLRPNGAACPPTCHVARSTLVLEFPPDQVVGNLGVNQAPRAGLLAPWIWPPWASTMRLQMLRPSP
jgi:hypothetical protein